MTIRPEALLNGWRGRRLLLELALRSEALRADRDGTSAPLAQAVMSASSDLDPNPGQSLVSSFGSGVPEATPAATPEAVASLLDAVQLADVDQDSALRVLADVVAYARYWQEPDGDDMLAATAVVRAALGRIATHVAGSAAAVGWWSEPVARADQHTVAWDDAPPVSTDGTGDPEVRLVRWRENLRVDERFAVKHAPADPAASWSGEWWSTPPSELPRTTRGLGRSGPAGLWLVEDGMGWERAVTRRVAVPAEARVCEIDGPDVWAALCLAHPLDVTAQKRHDWYRTTGRVERWVIPDWSILALEYDAVHLTAAAYLAAAGTAIPVDRGTCSVIAGWNPDETYWLTTVVRPEEDGAEWVLGDEDWVPGA